MLLLVRSLVILAIGWSAATAVAASPQVWIKENLGGIVQLYQHLHAHPELSFHEKETAARLADEWRRAGFEVTSGIGKHGVVAVLKNGDGPTLMLRCDLDALPVTEQTGLGYASKVKVQNSNDGSETGVMHACGHDIHMASLVGVARYLSANQAAWRGTLLLIGQPAEERGAGARAMLDDGLFEKWPKPDFAVALHVDATAAAGTVGIRGGYSLANVDSVDITCRGRGGHGAYPHTTIDPIVQAAQLVLALQTIVARELKPSAPAVVTVGAIHGGTKHNIIGDTCHLQLTVRSYSDDVRKQLLESIERKAKGVAIACGAPEPIIAISEGTPALFNDEKLSARLVGLFQAALGKEKVFDAEPSMGGEDFSRYGLAGVPVVMYRLGAIEQDRLARFESLGAAPPSLHSAYFYPDAEPVLATGIVSMSSVALELLKK